MNSGQNITPDFFWTDPSGEGRYLRAYFRRQFELSEAVSQAKLQVFVDGRYHLRVNGYLVGVGPCRFYPEHPEYDSHDLRPWLQAGLNVIALEVLHMGTATFHSILQPAGVAVWGCLLQADGTRIPLDLPEDWWCREASGYDRHTPKFSFATGPIQIYDERQAVRGWDGPLRDHTGWRRPVRLQARHWGKCTARTIPFLTQKERITQKLLRAVPHRQDECIYSFRAWDFSQPQNHFYQRKLIYAYTYIHSPGVQKVTAIGYWGEHYLNGRLLAKSPESRQSGQEMVLELFAGWNFLFISYGMWTETWDFHLAVPKAAGLGFHADKARDSAVIFKVSLTIPPEDPFVKNLQPQGMLEPPPVPGGWSDRLMPEAPVSPTRGLAWARHEKPLPWQPEMVGDLEVPPGPHSLIFDMGGEVLGRIFVEAETCPDTILDVVYAEDLKDGRPWYYKNVQVHAGERFITAGGSSTYQTFHSRGFRYLELGVSGHRTAVKIKRVGVIEQVYPHERRGWFRCSDPLLEKIWDAGWETLKVCSEDVYTDCPWRERTLYAGDLLAEMATALVCSGDTALSRRSLRLFLQSQSPETNWQQSMAPMDRSRAPLFDYPLLNLLACEWYVRLTGDRQLACEAYTAYRSLMRRCLTLRLPSGLYQSFVPPFIDHTGIGKPAISCPLNALIVRAWEAFAALAESQDQKTEAEEARAHAEELRIRVQTSFWDESAGAYVDGLTADEKPVADHSPAASYWCVFFGVATAEQHRDIFRHFAARWPRLQKEPEHFGTPYGGFFFLGALYAMETPEATTLAEKFIRQQWGPMIHAGSATIWEHFHPQASLAHAWSTAPNYYAITRTLGIRLGFPDRPSGQLLEITPESETLDWAEGAAPWKEGTLEVRWRIAGGRLDLRLSKPRDLSVRICPRGRLAKLALWVNGEPCPPDRIF